MPLKNENFSEILFLKKFFQNEKLLKVFLLYEVFETGAKFSFILTSF